MERGKMKQLNDHLKRVLRDQMKQPILYCPTHQCHCRFATEGWCLVEYSPVDCPYIKVRKEKVLNFKNCRL
jgi:hypothetical protein